MKESLQESSKFNWPTLLTAVTAIAALGSAFAAGLSTCYALKSIHLTDRQNRAFLNPEFKVVNIDRDGFRIGSNYFYSLNNTGRRPARDVRGVVFSVPVVTNEDPISKKFMADYDKNNMHDKPIVFLEPIVTTTGDIAFLFQPANGRDLYIALYLLYRDGDSKILISGEHCRFYNFKYIEQHRSPFVIPYPEEIEKLDKHLHIDSLAHIIVDSLSRSLSEKKYDRIP